MRKGDRPLTTSSYRYGTVAVLALVVLRLVIGWHFFREGADKLIAGDFTSVGFFKVAKGPLVPAFRWFIWDGDGQARLDQKATEDAWDQYRQRVSDHYGFDEQQQKQSHAVCERRKEQLKSFFEDKQESLEKFRKGLERRNQNRQTRAYQEVASLRGQAESIEKDLAKELGPWLATVDGLWKGYEQDLNELATDQQSSRGRLALGKPGRHLLDTLFIDQIIPYFDLIVGACLILGLCTRLSSLAGAGFLASIVATQWPGATGALPTYYQVIETVAMLVLAALGAGRFAGLDFFLEPWCLRVCKRCCAPKSEPKTENMK